MPKNLRTILPRLVGLACLLLALNVSGLGQSKPIKDLQPTVILISLDGFRYDYLDLYRPANLNSLAAGGVRAKWMVPSFPSKTFPNHYTIATGLYPQDHGIVENNIYDPDFKAVFTLTDRKEVENSRWWLGQPIWVTAERQGQKAASVFYPGTEGEIAGKRPSYWKRYDQEMSNDAREDTIPSWLDFRRHQRPTSLALYFIDPDDAGHEFGPVSKKTKKAGLKVDRVICRLIMCPMARQIFI